MRLLHAPVLAPVLALVLLCIATPVPAQQYTTMADRPDPRDFISRSDQRLTLLGNPIRFSGADLPWLGLRPDAAGGLHVPTAYETNDALATVQALAGSVIRARSLAGSAGCAECMEPSLGGSNNAAFAQLDRVLKQAHDMGMRLILPLAGGPGSCKAGGQEPYDGSICTYVAWRGAAGRAAFFTDPQLRADFLAHVTRVLEHVNALTGVAYADEPAILAWENCDACATADVDSGAASAWVEEVGRVVHEHDRHHLYENGAFAGRIGPHAKARVAVAELAPPSVDIVGDRIMPALGDATPGSQDVAALGADVLESRHVYIVDAFGWSPADWPAQQDFEAFLEGLAKRRVLTGALVAGLQGHADQGGFLPALPEAAGEAAEAPLYFPGTASGGLTAEAMEARSRVLRHLGFEMIDVRPTPGFAQPDPPQIISVVGGRVAWRGSAGAKSYSIERSTDLLAIGSWQLVCKLCVTDSSGPWQDPDPPKIRTFYRVSAANANNHLAAPSAPVESR